MGPTNARALKRLQQQAGCVIPLALRDATARLLTRMPGIVAGLKSVADFQCVSE